MSQTTKDKGGGGFNTNERGDDVSMFVMLVGTGAHEMVNEDTDHHYDVVIVDGKGQLAYRGTIEAGKKVRLNGQPEFRVTKAEGTRVLGQYDGDPAEGRRQVGALNRGEIGKSDLK